MRSVWLQHPPLDLQKSHRLHNHKPPSSIFFTSCNMAFNKVSSRPWLIIHHGCYTSWATCRAFFSMHSFSFCFTSFADSAPISTAVVPSKGLKYCHLNADPSTRASPVAAFVLSASFWAEPPEARWIRLTRSNEWMGAISASLKRTSVLVIPTLGPASMVFRMLQHLLGGLK